MPKTNHMFKWVQEGYLKSGIDWSGPIYLMCFFHSSILIDTSANNPRWPKDWSRVVIQRVALLAIQSPISFAVSRFGCSRNVFSIEWILIEHWALFSTFKWWCSSCVTSHSPLPFVGQGAGSVNSTGIAQRARHPDELKREDGKWMIDIDYYLAQQVRSLVYFL